MCAPSAPAAPDYKGAAEAQGKSQMTSTYTPYGSSVYAPDSTSPSGYRQDVSLDPNITRATNSLLPRVADQYSQPMDLSGVQQVADQSYGAQTARLDPQWDQREQQMQQQLSNQGIGLGSEAYSNAQRDFGQQRNDAYQQARLASIATMPQTYELAERQYVQPLNTLNALRTGTQMQQTQSVPYLNALGQQGQWNQGLFNADMGAYNNQLAGAATIGAALISDRRLKRNIKRIGTHHLGVGVYAYDIFGKPEIGVMAQEVLAVKPEAVIERNGFLMVNYGML